MKKTAFYVSDYVTKIAKIDPELFPDRARRFTTSRGIMIQFYPKQVNVTEAKPELDRDNLPWQDCWPDENFENCKKCIYKGKCRGHPPEYELLCNGKRMQDLPRRYIMAPVRQIRKSGIFETEYTQSKTVHCGQMNLQHAPCAGCLHVNECRLLFNQPYLPYHVVDHRTGELTKCQSMERKPLWKRRKQ